jgi:hypothetical protein
MLCSTFQLLQTEHRDMHSHICNFHCFTNFDVSTAFIKFNYLDQIISGDKILVLADLETKWNKNIQA